MPELCAEREVNAQAAESVVIFGRVQWALWETIREEELPHPGIALLVKRDAVPTSCRQAQGILDKSANPTRSERYVASLDHFLPSAKPPSLNGELEEMSPSASRKPGIVASWPLDHLVVVSETRILRPHHPSPMIRQYGSQVFGPGGVSCEFMPLLRCSEHRHTGRLHMLLAHTLSKVENCCPLHTKWEMGSLSRQTRV